MYAASTLVGVIIHPVEMRAVPTMETVDGTDDFTFYRNGAGDNLNDFTLDSLTVQSIQDFTIIQM